MENKPLFEAYLLTWFLYLIGIHSYARWKLLKQPLVIFSHAAPSLVALSMTFIFLIGQGVTVRQLGTGSRQGLDFWSLWAALWPFLLLVTFLSLFSHIMWVVIVSQNRPWRTWIPVPLLGIAMSVFSFWTVLQNFPDA